LKKMTRDFQNRDKIYIYSAADVRALDEIAINQEGIAGIVLMRRAGEATLQHIMARWPDLHQLTVLCGAGNNAGDGYIISGLAAMRGIASDVRWLVKPEKLKGDARTAWLWAREQGADIAPYTPQTSLKCQLIVDALLGTGLSGEVREAYGNAIESINEAQCPVVAVDIPSGINADTGKVMGSAVSADLTVTFIGRKRGLLTAEGKDRAGDVLFEDLDVPHSIYSSVADAVEVLDLDSLKSHMPPRARNSHKGDFGHLLMIGGDHGMPGSIAMASAAATRAGAGLVSVATRSAHITPLVANRPEVMVHGVESGQEFAPLLADSGTRYQAIVIGPGLGASAWSQQLIQIVLGCHRPMVIDADGLNLLAKMPVAKRDNWVLTPHPGEAARLLGVTTTEIQNNRFDAVARLQSRYGGVVLLKGAGTLIADGVNISLCPYGNPGMASGGMGDVLTGVIGGLLAQGIEGMTATQLGACLHARAADLQVASYGEIGLLATDLYEDIRELLNFSSAE
jgi:NAD(P)H-hydrate epimerase